MSLDAAIRRLEVLQCEKAKVSNCDTDSDSGGYCKRGVGPVDRSLSYYRARKKAVDLVQKDGESSEEYFMRAREILHCLDPEDERWLVNAFVNGLIDDRVQGALDKARKGNKSLTLVQAYEQLAILASPVNGTNINSNCDAGIERSIAVDDIPVHILVDPVAFQKFLVINNFQPLYRSSGCYSNESIRFLHDEFSQLTEDEIADVAPLMKTSAEIALMQQKVSRSNRYEFPAANPAFSLTTVMVNFTSEHVSCNDNNLNDQQDETEIATLEPVPVSRRAMRSDYNLSPTDISTAAAEPAALRAGKSGNSLGGFGPEPEVWGTSIVNQSMEPYQNTTGGKEVGKWREKDECRKIDDTEKDVSMMGLGMKSAVQDLVDSGWKLDIRVVAGKPDGERTTALVILGELESWAEEKHETTETPEKSNRPHCAGAIQNPSVLHIQTASEWDPGLGELDHATPDTNGGRDLLTRFSPEPIGIATAENEIPQANTLNGRHWFGSGHYGRSEVVLLGEWVESESGIRVEKGKSPYLRREGAGREEESRAGENALEGNELGELAGRQAVGF